MFEICGLLYEIGDLRDIFERAKKRNKLKYLPKRKYDTKMIGCFEKKK